MGRPPKYLSLPETGSPAYTGTCLAQSLKQEFIANTDCPDSLILEIPQASPSDMATRSLPLYFAHIVKVKCAHPHLLTILTSMLAITTAFEEADVTAAMCPLFL